MQNPRLWSCFRTVLLASLLIAVFPGLVFTQVSYDRREEGSLKKVNDGKRGVLKAEVPFISAEVSTAAADFRRRHGDRTRTIFLPGSRHPAILLGFAARPGKVTGSTTPLSSTPEVRAAQHALAFMESEPVLTGITEPLNSLVVSNLLEAGDLTVVRFQQQYEKIPVLGGMVSAHVDAAGNVRALVNDFQFDIQAPTRPRITEDAALRLALAHLRGGRQGPMVVPARSRLGIVRLADGTHLVWDFWVRIESGSYRVLIDALTGVDLGSASLLRSVDCSPKPRGQYYPESPVAGNYITGELVDLKCHLMVLDGEFIRSFNWAGTDEWTFDPTFDFGLRGRRTGGSVFFGSTASVGLAQVTIFQHASRFHNWLNDLGFHELDRPFPMVANVEECWWEFPCENAFYDPLYHYSTGFGLCIFGTSPKVNFGLEIDVICHEYTHGVVHETAELGADFFEEDVFFANALDEAFADFFACTFVGNPELGEYTGIAWDEIPLRNLDNNMKYPADVDWEYYHDTGQIWSGALWDIREALSNNGQDKAAIHEVDLLAYTTLISLPSDADFLRAGGAAVAAAESLDFSAAQVSTVRNIMVSRGLSIGGGGTAPLTVVPLEPDVEVEGDVAARTSGSFRMASTQYKIDVPGGASRLLIELEGTGDLDLHVRANGTVIVIGKKILSSFSAEGPGARHSIEVLPTSDPPLSQGNWLVAVTNRSSSFATFTLRATLELDGADTIQPIVAGETHQGSIVGGPILASVQYALELDDVQNQRLQVDLSSAGEVDLFLRHGDPIEVGNEGQIVADVIARTPGNSESIVLDFLTLPGIQTGTYYLAISNESADPVSYDLEAKLLDIGPPVLDEEVLTSGVSESGSVPEAPTGAGIFGSTQYVIPVPAEGSRLVVELSSTGNLDLYMRLNERVSFENGRVLADHAANLLGTGNEILTVDLLSSPPLEEGNYSIAVVNRGAREADFQIRAVVDTEELPAGTRNISSGFWLDVVVDGTGVDNGIRLASTQYRLTVAQDAPGLDVLTESVSAGNIDLYVRRDRPVQLIDDNVIADEYAETERGAESITIFKRDLAPGDYYIALVSRHRSDVSVRLLAVATGLFPLSAHVGEGDVYQGIIAEAPAPPTGCRLTLDQFVVEVPANALRLQIFVLPLEDGPLEILLRHGSRILIDLEGAVYDSEHSTDDGPVIIDGNDLKAGNYFFAISNCQAVEQNYEVWAILTFPGSNAEIPLLDGFPTKGILESGSPHGELSTTQYTFTTIQEHQEFLVSTWRDECEGLDYEILVALNEKVIWDEGGNTNAAWRSQRRGRGAEHVIINSRSNPALQAGQYFIALLNHEREGAEINIGTTGLSAESIEITPDSPMIDTVVTSGVPGIGLLHGTQYRFEVIPGVDRLQADLTPTGDSSLDIDLFGRFGLPMVITPEGFLIFDLASAAETGVESLRFATTEDCLQPGLYYFAVGNFESVNVEFSLTPSIIGSGCIPVATGDTVGGTMPSSIGGLLKAPDEQFCLVAERDAPGFQIDLAATEGNVDLFLRLGQPVDFSGNNPVASFRSTGENGLESISIPASMIAPGRYFIAVGTRASEEVSFVLSVRELEEVDRSIDWDGLRDGVAPESTVAGLGWLSSDQFLLIVPADQPRLEVRLETGLAGSDIELHLREGRRVKVEGTRLRSDVVGAGIEETKSIVIENPVAGDHYIAVRNLQARTIPYRLYAGAGGVSFIRGDTNEDGGVNLTDPVATLNHLFIDARIICSISADANADGGVNVTDAVYTLDYLFRGGPVLPAPFPECGRDPTVTDAENCTGKGCQ